MQRTSGQSAMFQGLQHHAQIDDIAEQQIHPPPIFDDLQTRLTVLRQQ